MSSKHELEIEIGPNGKIQVHVKGAKGKKCLDYADIFAKIGKTTEKKFTGEYYEPDSSVLITNQTQKKFGEY